MRSKPVKAKVIEEQVPKPSDVEEVLIGQIDSGTGPQVQMVDVLDDLAGDILLERATGLEEVWESNADGD